MKKYFFFGFVVCLSLFIAVVTSEYDKKNSEMTLAIASLKSIQTDLRLDTLNFNRTILKLEVAAPILLEAMNGLVASTDLTKLHKLLPALRAYHSASTQNLHALEDLEKINFTPHNPNLLYNIHSYQQRLTVEGNLGGFNKDFSDITFENHKKLFEAFPNYLHPDSLVANQSILNGATAFLQNPYWQARIALTHRQINSYNKAAYITQKGLAIKIIEEISQELAHIKKMASLSYSDITH